MGCSHPTKRNELVEQYAQRGCDAYMRDPLRAQRRPYVYELARFAAAAPTPYTSAVIDRLVVLIAQRQTRTGRERVAKSGHPRNTW